MSFLGELNPLFLNNLPIIVSVNIFSCTSLQSLEASAQSAARSRSKSRSTMKERWTVPATCPRTPASSPPRPPPQKCWCLTTPSTPPSQVHRSHTTQDTAKGGMVIQHFSKVKWVPFERHILIGWTTCVIFIVHRCFWRVSPWSAPQRPPERRLRSLLESKSVRLSPQRIRWPCKRKVRFHCFP